MSLYLYTSKNFVIKFAIFSQPHNKFKIEWAIYFSLLMLKSKIVGFTEKMSMKNIIIQIGLKHFNTKFTF